MGRAFEYRKARIMARNSKNSKMFSKLSKEITMCVKASGPDPDNNSRLRTLIATAKSASMLPMFAPTSPSSAAPSAQPVR